MQALRKRFGWSQKCLAEEVGVQRNTVALWEMGRHQPSRMALQFLRRLNLELEGNAQAVQLTELTRPPADAELQRLDKMVAGGNPVPENHRKGDKPCTRESPRCSSNPV